MLSAEVKKMISSGGLDEKMAYIYACSTADVAGYREDVYKRQMYRSAYNVTLAQITAFPCTVNRMRELRPESIFLPKKGKELAPTGNHLGGL